MTKQQLNRIKYFNNGVYCEEYASIGRTVYKKGDKIVRFCEGEGFVSEVIKNTWREDYLGNQGLIIFKILSTKGDNNEEI